MKGYLKIINLYEVSSTNDCARDLAEKGAREVTVVRASYQTKGRGRHGREWVSPENKGIYVSFLLRPVSFRTIELLNFIGALSVVKSLKGIINTEINWPNDVGCGGRKIAGISVQTGALGKNPEFAVTGIGVNINSTRDDIPENATSLFLETGKEYSLDKIFSLLLKEFMRLYSDFSKGRKIEITGEVNKFMRFDKLTGSREGAKWFNRDIMLGIDDSDDLVLCSPGIQEKVSKIDLVSGL